MALLSLWRARGDPWAVAIALLNVGGASRASGDLLRAAANYREALALFAAHGDRAKVASCLEGLGHLATIDGKAEQAVRLFGTAEAIYQSLGFQLPHHDPSAYEPALAAVHAALDGNVVAVAWADGRALSFEQALVEAKDVADSLAGDQD